MEYILNISLNIAVVFSSCFASVIVFIDEMCMKGHIFLMGRKNDVSTQYGKYGISFE